MAITNAIPMIKMRALAREKQDELFQKALDNNGEVQTLIENLFQAMKKSAEQGHFYLVVSLGDNISSQFKKALADNSAVHISDSRFVNFEKYAQIVERYFEEQQYKINRNSSGFEISWH